MGSALKRVGRARALLQKGQLAERLDQVSSRFLPAGNPLLYWDRFLVVALAPGQARPPARVERIPVLASIEDIEQLCRAHPDRAALFRRRLDEGQRCFVIHEEGRIVARQWVVGDRPVHDTNSGLRFVTPARPALWCHDIFVEPAYRQRGLFAALMWGVLEREAERRPYLYGEIHFLNEASIRAHLTFGHRIIRSVTVVSVLGWKTYAIRDERGHTTVEGHHAWRVRHI
jgi:GNAT superfamily N-acetyltransferase